MEMNEEKIQAVLKFQKLSDISENLGYIFFVSLFLGPVVENNINYFSIFSGLVISMSWWFVALFFIKRLKWT